MFDLMGAIRQRQKTQPAPPADSAETAETPQPRAGERAEGLRRTADNSAGEFFSATIRKNPQSAKPRQPAKTEGFREFSANPQNPQTPTGKNTQNPDAILRDIAETLGADDHMLRALLDSDDMQAIAEGTESRAHLLAYFRQMAKDGKPLADPQWHLDQLVRQGKKKSRQQAHDKREWEQAWRAAHESFMDHLTGCPDCYAPRGHYCTTGANLRRAYLQTYQPHDTPE